MDKENTCLICGRHVAPNSEGIGAHLCVQERVPSVLYSKWCISCYPTKKPAEFTYSGDSLCEEHFKLRKEELEN